MSHSEHENNKPDRHIRRARLAGAILQGIVLGFFLVPALIELASLAGAITPFKYQGF